MRKSFDLIVKSVKSFSIIVSGITEATTFRFFTNNTFQIVTQIKQRIRFLTTLKMGAARINILKMSLLGKISTNIRMGNVIISTTFKEIGKIQSNIVVALSINAYFQERIRFLTNIKNGKMRITTTLVVGQFFKLFNYDQQTLSSMDSSTLGTLDYTES